MWVIPERSSGFPFFLQFKSEFSSSHVWVWKLDYKESWVQKNWCFWTVVLEKTLESPLGCKEIQLVHSNGNQSWIVNGRTDVDAETSILWPPDAMGMWERLKAGGEGDYRGWDGWMASPTQWKWVWVNCWSWWWAGRPCVLQSMGSQKVGHDWATELNWFYKNLSPLINMVAKICTFFS